MPSNSRNSYGFGLGGPLPALAPTPIISTRVPVAGDNIQEIGTTWINTTTNQAWTMTGSAAGAATWSLSSPGASDVDTLTGDAGGALSPVAGNINILGGATANVTGAGNTLTVNPSANGFPVSPYVVGAVGEAGYQTIAAAITAAAASGTDQTIFVQPGTYTEDLTLVDGVDIKGSSYASTIITGTHIPPAAGAFLIQDCTLTDATDIFNSAVAGAAVITVEDCIINCTNGYLFNLVNWTGTLEVFDSSAAGTNDGFVNNTGGATVTAVSSELGVGVGNAFTASAGTVRLRDVEVRCPGTFGGAATVDIDGSIFQGTITTAATAAVLMANSVIQTGANAAIAHASAGAFQMSESVVNSSNATPIGGTGTITLGNITFEDRSAIAGTLTTAYSRSINRVTSYIVGPTGNYETIQAALDAANATGIDQTVIVQPGTYTEDLTLYTLVDIKGNIYTGTTITGVHVPPAAGRCSIQDCTLTSGTHIFDSAAAGTTDITIEDCLINCTNGNTFNLLNWTGTLSIFDSGDVSTANGVVNNTGGATVEIFASDVGVGANAFTMSDGAVTIRATSVGVAGTFGGAATVDIDSSVFEGTITTAATAAVLMANSVIQTGANAAIAHGSAGAFQMSEIVVNSSNATPIGGAGAGNLSLGNITFEDRSAIAGTITQNYLRAINRTSNYIVGPTGNFETIQAAVDAANASAVPQTVIIQPGAYAENVTLYDNIHIRGSSYVDVVITGVHVPPNAGDVLIQNCTLASGTHVFNSAAAGTTNITIEDCLINCTNGYTFNLLNWTGTLQTYDCGDVSTANGFINNTGGATVTAVGSELGVGAGNAFVMSDCTVRLRQVDLRPPGTFGAATTADIVGGAFFGTITTAGTATLLMTSGVMQTGATAAINHGSAGTTDLDGMTINSANAPAIAGAGAGVLTLGSCVFENNAALAGTLTLGYNQTTTGLLEATGAHTINSGAAADITFTMGDNAGANGVIFNDLAGNPVLTIDSNGGITPAGAFAVVGAFTQTAGIVNIGADAAANAVNIATGAAAKVVTIGSVTGASQLDLLAGTGNFSLEGNIATTYAISNVGINTGQVDIAGGTGARTINIGAGGTGAKTIGIGAAASADVITIGDATGAGSLDLVCGTGNFTLEGNIATTYAISNVGVNTGQVDIAGGTGARTINIGDGGTGAKTINIGAAASADVITIGDATGAGSLDLVSGTGGITATGGAAGVTADFVTRTGDDIVFTMSPLTCTWADTGGVATGATGDVNLLSFQEGMIMEQFVIGAGQTIIKPVMTATGLLISGDETNIEGYEYNFGAVRANSRHSFTIGTSPAFFLRWTFRADDISGLEPCYCGFRRTQANQAVGNIALYTDFVAYGPNDGISPGDAAISTQLNTGGLVNTDTNDAWADTATHELTILVSAAGVVTFEFDAGAPTVTQAYTFDNGDVVHPFFRHEFNAVLPDAIEWIDFQCGFQ